MNNNNSGISNCGFYKCKYIITNCITRIYVYYIFDDNYNIYIFIVIMIVINYDKKTI